MKKSYESKYKIILAICLAAMLAVSLCACGGGSESGSEAASSGSASTEAAVEKTDKESAAKKKETKKKEEKKESEQKESEQEKAEEARQESEETQNSEAKSSNQSTANKETKKEAKKESKPAKKKYCHIVIQCKKLVGRDDIEPGYEDMVPSSGYILQGVNIEIHDGDTVYDVLKRAGKEYNFIINVEQTQFDAYIAGIAGLDEKICGEESGWKYKVNGSYPGKSCAKVKVSDGDKVVWVYVLKA